MTSLKDFTANRIDGTPLSFADLQGRALLVVNTASACGFTPQFEGLEELHKTYGAQDSGTNEEIGAFCQRNYGVSFAMMEKVEVNGDNAHPLFKWLKSEAPGLLGSEAIKWNFTKFLVGKDGRVLKRYASMDAPAKLAKDIEAALAA